MNEGSSSYLGPGYYEANDSLLIQRNRGGAVPYSKDTSHRSVVGKVSPGKGIGPGSYDLL